jgi:hypothetical protein
MGTDMASKSRQISYKQHTPLLYNVSCRADLPKKGPKAQRTLVIRQMFKKWCQNETHWYELMVSGKHLRPIIPAALIEHQTPTPTPCNGTLWIAKVPSDAESSQSPNKSKTTFHATQHECRVYRCSMWRIKIPGHKLQSCFVVECLHHTGWKWINSVVFYTDGAAMPNAVQVESSISFSTSPN